MLGDEKISAPSGLHTGPSVNSKPPATCSTRAGTGDLVEARREALELEGHGTTHARALARVEVERRGAHPDVVVREAEIGPLMPNTASWKLSPGRASRVSTTRLGALKPPTTWPPVSPSATGNAPSTHTSA